MTDTKLYSTTDFYVTAMLLSQKFSVESIASKDNTRRTKVFSFVDSKELREAVKQYMNGTMVGNLREFRNSIDQVKDLIHQ